MPDYYAPPARLDSWRSLMRPTTVRAPSTATATHVERVRISSGSPFVQVAPRPLPTMHSTAGDSGLFQAAPIIPPPARESAAATPDEIKAAFFGEDPEPASFSIPPAALVVGGLGALALVWYLLK